MRNSARQRILSASIIAFAFGAAPTSTPAQETCGNGITVGSCHVACAGDCDGDGIVTVNEIVELLNGALVALTGGSGDFHCPAADANCDGFITVDEIVAAVNNALNGCGASDFDAGEECDNGGLCVGGADAGDPCSSETDCEGDGACFGGLDNLRGCSGDDDCREGSCRKCRPYGGDGCAANCTSETDINFPLVPGQVDQTAEIVFGTSGAHIKGPFLYVPLPLTGSLIFTSGKIAGGQTPVVLKTSGIDFDRIPVSTIACACVRGAVASTCGGTLFDAGGLQSANCTPGFNGVAECPPDKKCAAVHGPGNTASGFITCGGIEVDIDVRQDCNGTPDAEPFDPIVTVTQSDPPEPLPLEEGAGHIVTTAAIGTVVGACSGGTAEYGPDGQFCTDDDPLSNRGIPNSIEFTTGNVTGSILNPGDFDGDVLGPYTEMGAPFSCGGETIGVHGANLAGIFTSCDQPTVSDIVVPVNFASP